MKKILTFIIIIAMTLSLGVPAFAAAPATVTVASPTAAVTPGSTVNVAVTIANNPGMDVMKLKFSYDTTALTLKDMKLGSVMTGTFTQNLDKAVALLEAAGTTNATGNGTLVTLKFEVKSTAAAGNYTIGFLVADAVNRDEVRVALTTQAGTVSVTVPVTTYTVKFNANGGTGTMADVTGVPAGAYTLPANGFTAPAGKQFKGWSTGASGAVIEGTTYNVTGDVTLYAIWEDKPHTHTYSTAWSTDETNHWHECTCGDKKDVAAHTPGAAATETTPQTCTICGYVIKAALGHTHNFNQKNTSETYLKSAATCTKKAVYYYSCTCGEKGTETFESGETAPHSYSTEWSSDKTNHWHKCANCDAVADKAAHRYDNACDTTCNDCGKTREITHSYGEAWSSDETNHWHECSVCHAKKDEAAHIPGAEATETTAQTCTVCGYVIKAALGHTHNFNQKNTSETYLKSAATCTKKAVYYYSCTCGEKGTETFESGETAPHSYSTEWSSDKTNHWHKCANCDAVADKAAHRYDNACDTTCNDCGKTREITHSYSEVWSSDETNHWHECSVCHTKKDEAAHIYDNACDKDCNICGQTREVTHSYSEVWSYDETNHWHECSVCHTKKDETPHTYDNACDTTCNDCGKTREITHSYSEVWSNDETNHWHECSVCHTKKDEAAHIPGAEATETTAQTCTVCGYVIKAPLGHTHRPTIVRRVEPTCEKAGNIEHYKCSCGKLYYDAAATKEITNAAKIILSATGHARGGDWKYSEIYHWHECAVCGERMDTAFHRAGAEATETTPQTCAVCGYVIKEALGHTHSFTEKNTDAKYLKSAATCKASAEYYYSCSCGEKGTETFKSGEKLAHNFKTEWSSNGEKHWHECSLCGEKNKESSHRFEWKTDKAATATEAGSKHEECTVCGYKKTAIAIDKLAPSIIDGRNAKWNKGGENNLTFKSDAVFSDFVEVLVDGKTITAENYEKREGSIIIELKASYLETLAEGEHTLTIRSASGGATTKFTVEAEIVSPPTSSTSVWVWIIIAVVALGVGATIVVFVIRKRKMA